MTTRCRDRSQRGFGVSLNCLSVRPTRKMIRNVLLVSLIQMYYIII